MTDAYSLNDLRDQRAGAWAQMQQIRATVERSGWTPALRADWDRLDTSITDVIDDIGRAERARGLDTGFSGTVANLIAPIGPNVGESRSVVERDTPLTRGQSVAEWSRKFEPHAYRDGDRDLNLAKLLRGMATGRWDSADLEQRAMAEGTQGAGGAIVPTPLSAELIDLARNQTRVIQAGARTVPMDSQTLKIARVATDPTASWKVENATAGESSPTVDSILLTAQLLAVYLRVSIELVEDAPNTGDIVRHIIAAAIAQ